MNLKFEMKGSVNGHYFEIEGEGKGKLYAARNSKNV